MSATDQLSQQELETWQFENNMQVAWYVEVIIQMFSYRPIYQARASITAETKSRADVDRGLDVGADMKTAML